MGTMKWKQYDMAFMQKAVERWVKQGTPHEPLSEHIYEIISDLDFALGDSFAFKSGGDGDNGEQLMYLLDAYFRLNPQGEL